MPDGDKYRRVVEFDAQVEKVPPHVASRLTGREVRQLRRYLADRARLKAEPAAENMLHVLPDVLHEATESLAGVEQVNESVYRRIDASLRRFRAALQEVTPEEDGQSKSAAGGRSMPKSDELKHRLERLTHDA